MPIFKRGLVILHEKGVHGFIHETKKYMQKTLENIYWSFKDVQTLSIGPYSGKFIIPNSATAQQNKYRKNTEQDIILDLMSELSDKIIFFDIGANTGIYSVLAANITESGNIIAFEPYPPNYELLLNNFKKNNMNSSVALNIALSNKSQEIEFEAPENKFPGYGSATISMSSNGETINISANSCDDLVNRGKVPTPNIVKIDVEGSEALVVDGMIETLSSDQCRLVYCEIHTESTDRRPSIQEFGSSKNDLINKLEKLGFEVQILQERKGEIFIKGMKNNT